MRKLGAGNPWACQTSMSQILLSSSASGKKKADKHKLFCPVGLGTTPGLSRGFHRVCPWDKSGENLGQTRVFSLFYTVEARQTRVCPWDKPGLSLGQTRGRRAAQKVYVKKVYVPFSLASAWARRHDHRHPPSGWCTQRGSYSASVFLPSKHLLSAFYDTPPF